MDTEFTDDPRETDPDPGDVTDAPETDAPAFDYDAPEFQDAVARAASEQIGSMLEQAGQYDEQDDPSAEGIDPAFLQLIDQRFDKRIDQRFSQIEPTVEAFREHQNQQTIDGFIGQVPAISEAQALLPEDSEVQAENLTRQIAFALVPELEERFGQGSQRAVQAALRQAGDIVHGAIKTAHQAGYQARNAELGRLSGAPPPGPPSAEGVSLREEPESIMAATDAWSARNGLR